MADGSFARIFLTPGNLNPTLPQRELSNVSSAASLRMFAVSISLIRCKSKMTRSVVTGPASIYSEVCTHPECLALLLYIALDPRQRYTGLMNEAHVFVLGVFGLIRGLTAEYM